MCRTDNFPLKVMHLDFVKKIESLCRATSESNTVDFVMILADTGQGWYVIKNGARRDCPAITRVADTSNVLTDGDIVPDTSITFVIQTDC